jgi:hypothetical protein
VVRVKKCAKVCESFEQVAKHVPGGDYTVRDRGIVLPEKKDVYGNIEGLMNHFMLIMKGCVLLLEKPMMRQKQPMVNWVFILSVMVGRRLIV